MSLLGHPTEPIRPTTLATHLLELRVVDLTRLATLMALSATELLELLITITREHAAEHTCTSDERSAPPVDRLWALHAVLLLASPQARSPEQLALLLDWTLDEAADVIAQLDTKLARHPGYRLRRGLHGAVSLQPHAGVLPVHLEQEVLRTVAPLAPLTTALATTLREIVISTPHSSDVNREHLDLLRRAGVITIDDHGCPPPMSPIASGRLPATHY